MPARAIGGMPCSLNDLSTACCAYWAFWAINGALYGASQECEAARP